MELCNDCKTVTICSCQDFCLAPDGGITAGVDYIVTLTDKFGTEYSQEVTASVYGTLCIDTTQFPDGFFNPYAGTMIITITTAADTDTDIQVVYNSINYECVSLRIKDCENSEANPPTPAADECLCFTDVTQLQSDWSETDTNSVRYIRNKPTVESSRVQLLAQVDNIDINATGEFDLPFVNGATNLNDWMPFYFNIEYVDGAVDVSPPQLSVRNNNGDGYWDIQFNNIDSNVNQFYGQPPYYGQYTKDSTLKYEMTTPNSVVAHINFRVYGIKIT